LRFGFITGSDSRGETVLWDDDDVNPDQIAWVDRPVAGARRSKFRIGSSPPSIPSWRTTARRGMLGRKLIVRSRAVIGVYEQRPRYPPIRSDVVNVAPLRRAPDHHDIFADPERVDDGVIAAWARPDLCIRERMRRSGGHRRCAKRHTGGEQHDRQTEKKRHR
jgi:hypothetical protein